MATNATEFFPDKTSNPEVVKIYGRVTPANTADPTLVSGRGFTVTRVSQGLYRIHTNFSWNHLLHFEPHLALTTKDTWFAQSANAESAANRTIDFRVIDETNALIDVNGEGDVTFDLVLARTAVKPL